MDGQPEERRDILTGPRLGAWLTRGPRLDGSWRVLRAMHTLKRT